jgi:hypothetical protein
MLRILILLTILCKIKCLTVDGNGYCQFDDGGNVYESRNYHRCVFNDYLQANGNETPAMMDPSQSFCLYGVDVMFDGQCKHHSDCGDFPIQCKCLSSQEAADVVKKVAGMQMSVGVVGLAVGIPCFLIASFLGALTQFFGFGKDNRGCCGFGRQKIYVIGSSEEPRMTKGAESLIFCTGMLGLIGVILGGIFMGAGTNKGADYDLVLSGSCYVNVVCLDYVCYTNPTGWFQAVCPTGMRPDYNGGCCKC